MNHSELYDTVGEIGAVIHSAIETLEAGLDNLGGAIHTADQRRGAAQIDCAITALKVAYQQADRLEQEMVKEPA